ncbi:SOS response-associated peptidase [Brevundimonas nasdae]|uniref:Abasic site processing protein n=1 Tax=Brevundimonas nasdae TaxID=172043 RepID=A0ABX8TNL8_9CAUL|nr:SOS response-associated peptidase [Brevundimonas nasdae]QYC11475.1 SOS response-associated peptidase [Brevundimonas nasdae]QYC14263.1 SOS response-associated peptidase [Brevundimonas nasdae]
MCNEYQLKLPIADIVATLVEDGVAAAFPEGRPNLEPQESIRIGDRAPVIRTSEAGAELRLLPWSWRSPQGRPVFNFRSDDRSFADVQRCLIPADGFFEFTAAEPGQKRKTKWRFSLADAPLFWIAGLVRQDAFAMLTTEPGADIAPYHDRQIVVLRPEEGAAWLDLRGSERDLLRPLPAGSLNVEKVFPG